MFADLAQQVETAPIAGSVYERKRDGIDYLYAKVPVGSVRADIFLGRKGEATAEEKARSMRTGMALAAERRALVSTLKRHGLTGPEKWLGVALDAVAQANLLRDGAVLVGTAAYMLFEPLVGRRLPAPSLMTNDLDIATASLALSADPPETMQAILRRADPSYEAVPTLDPRAPPWRFRSARGTLVDLIAPIRRSDRPNPLPLEALQAGATALQYIAWLIADPVRTIALWGAGIPVAVPQPARFAIHKLILAQRRDLANRPKRHRDLHQAAALIEALRDYDPFALEDALADARGRGRQGWAIPIERSLAELEAARK